MDSETHWHVRFQGVLGLGPSLLDLDLLLLLLLLVHQILPEVVLEAQFMSLKFSTLATKDCKQIFENSHL